EGIAREQYDVHRHDQRADADAELARAGRHRAVGQHAVHGPAGGEEHVVRENEDEHDSGVHEEPVHVLEDEGERRLAPIAVPWLAHRTGYGVEEEGPIVGLAVVVARQPEAEREDENQKRRRERPPRRPQQWRIEGREVRAPLVVRPGPCRPGGVDGEAAEHECRKRRRHPPGIAPQRRADAALLQVSERRRHSFTAAMVCFTASADFWSVARSSSWLTGIPETVVYDTSGTIVSPWPPSTIA